MHFKGYWGGVGATLLLVLGIAGLVFAYYVGNALMVNDHAEVRRFFSDNNVLPYETLVRLAKITMWFVGISGLMLCGPFISGIWKIDIVSRDHQLEEA